MFSVESVRKDFPILSEEVNGKPLVYLDNAATAQKPNCVIRSIESYYRSENANIHRGVFYLSEQATESYESTRDLVAQFLSAEKRSEIIFCKGVTEAINLVAQGFSKTVLKEGDEVLISHMEHHANIVPWQIACEETGALLKVVPVLEDGSLDMDAFEKLLSDKTKLVSVVHVSNALGTINPVEAIVKQAHARGIPVLLDGAQSAPHMAIDVQALDCDFFVASGHKLFAPTGVGVLYGKESWLERLPPYQGGGI